MKHHVDVVPILGIWDGHDAGAAVVYGEDILIAINEERLSRKKLDIGFPTRSIEACLAHAGLSSSEIGLVSVSTTDFAKTLTRCVPKLREEYYLLRRKKKMPGMFNRIKKLAKYKLTELPPSYPTKKISERVIKKELSQCGFTAHKIQLVDHHRAHAASAAFCSGFDDCLVLTIDGIGDGLSGSVWSFREGKLELVTKIPGKHSLGIFFEHVTNLLNMRELEDEGKVMALANFAYPIPDEENPLLSFFTVKDLDIRCNHSSLKLYRELAKVLWRYPSEQFAYLAQRTLEVTILRFVQNALQKTNHHNIAYAGGVASNVKVNMLMYELEELSSLFVFPHMGDGGLGFGAAAVSNYDVFGVSKYSLADVFFGPEYSADEIDAALSPYSEFSVEKGVDVVSRTAELLSRGEILMWFQGRMEFGPRALGARSILALPNSVSIKDALNLKLKKRVWYQPFCPSMLEEDAREVLLDYNGQNEAFMTCAYRTRPEMRDNVQGVINVDGTCRPQILTGKENHRYTDLLHAVKQRTGRGILLNTSFNIHGEPMVCSPADALNTFAQTEIDYIVIDDYLVSKKPS